MTTAVTPRPVGTASPKAAEAAPGRAAADHIISVRGLFASLGGRPVLEDVTFDVAPGRFVGIVGPNGAGKTTLLRLLMGLLRPDRGTILVFGRPPHRPGDTRHWVGYAPQRTDFNRWFPLSVLDVVMMGLGAHRGPLRRFRREDVEAALESLRQVGLAGLRHRPIGALSGGQQQRVFLARALAGETKLLLLDEPSTGLDIPSQARFYDLLKTLQTDLGLTVVTVSHDLTSLARFADEFIAVNRRVYVQGEPGRVLQDPALGRAYGWAFAGEAFGAGAPGTVPEDGHNEAAQDGEGSPFA